MLSFLGIPRNKLHIGDNGDRLDACLFVFFKRGDEMSILNSFDDCIEKVKQQRDVFLGDMSALDQRYRERESKLKRKFDMWLLDEKLLRMNEEKQEEVKGCINDFETSTGAIIDQLRTKIDLFIKLSSFDDLAEIERFANVPLTKQEFSYLCQRYGNLRNYWNERYLSYLASINGIESPCCPSVDQMQEVITDLEKALKCFTEGFTSGEKVKDDSLLSDDFLSVLSEKFKNEHSQERSEG